MVQPQVAQKPALPEAVDGQTCAITFMSFLWPFYPTAVKYLMRSEAGDAFSRLVESVFSKVLLIVP